MLEELDTKAITQIDTSAITLTKAAADAVKNILAERNLDGYGLRVYVAGGGAAASTLAWRSITISGMSIPRSRPMV